jgi:hypothetical protein
MAKVAVPIIKLRYPAEYAFHNSIQDVFEAAGAWREEEAYTYTGRMTVYESHNPNAEAQKAQIEQGLRALVEAGVIDDQDLNALLALFKEHDWDVSFFVDCW